MHGIRCWLTARTSSLVPIAFYDYHYFSTPTAQCGYFALTAYFARKMGIRAARDERAHYRRPVEHSTFSVEQ